MFNKDTAKHMAELSMLKFTDYEFDTMLEYMSDVTEMLDTVRSFPDVTDLCSRTAIPFSDLRPDEHCQEHTQSEALKNTDNKKNGYFTVPKII